MAAVSMGDQLKILVELQGLDAQLYRLRSELKSKPLQADRLRSGHHQNAQDLKVTEDQYKSLEVKRNEMEVELGEKEAQIRKLQIQLYQLKTNKEYAAMQKEIEGLKADKSVLEEEILKLMEEIERLKDRLKKEREALKIKEGDLQKALAKLEEEARLTQDRIQELQAARADLTPRVESGILTRYERILERKEGVALAQVRQDHACSGCHMVLPPQTINEIQMNTHLVTCESCSRILYLEPSG